MALVLTQPLTEISTRNLPGGKGGQCVGLTILPPSCADCFEISEPEPAGTFRACPETALPFYILQPTGLPLRSVVTRPREQPAEHCAQSQQK